MSDRWNPRKIVTDTPKPALKLYVPGGPASLPSTVTEHPAGFRVRTRGDTTGTVKHAYRCPVHGVFEVMVPRSEVPDEVPCPEQGMTLSDPADAAHFECHASCGCPSKWAGSSCGIGISSGMVRS